MTEDDAYRAMGRFISACSKMDGFFSGALAAVANMQGPVDAFIIHAIDFNRKREIVRGFVAMSALHPVAEIKELERLSKKAAELMDDRNTVAHGALQEVNGEFKLFRVGFPALANLFSQPNATLEVSKLDALSDKADAIGRRFYEIEAFFEGLRKVRGAPPA